ncbi:MXAN_6230/SCO0854 family RING domain-containing protein, partial [Microtetraspora sp. AC03309]|uniref:MXAN_6230/SCO0854 family RING domain-containing protein n=1 Tax=Microtetraspora sp. AC03309 TaxID=2779376 RepID=UPI001E620610
MNGLAEMLLRRHRLVAPGLLARDPAPAFAGTAPQPRKQEGADRAPSCEDGLAALEADLLQLGYVVSASLRRALSELTADELANAGGHLIHGVLAELGGYVEHVPLFRNFPASVPADTAEFYVRRVFTLLLQRPEQPCVLCGLVTTVHPVSPCAHLVCRACWDGSDFSACPICHRRVDPDDPFLRPADDPVAEAGTANGSMSRVATVLSLCADPAETARDHLRVLLSRRTPLRKEDLATVGVLIREFWPRAINWLPERIPVRETRAVVLAAAMRHGGDSVPELLDRYVDSATDVLRLLTALMGGDPGLRQRLPRRSSLSRAIRRALLSHLDRMPVPYLIEDLHRHPEAWKHMAEVLHPHEHHTRHPDAALAFAALRGTRLDGGGPLATALLDRAAAYPGLLRFDGVRLRASGLASRVETALRDGDHATALTLLGTRPGELARRVAHLARRVPAEPLAAAVAEAAPRVSPGVLIAALGQVRTPPGGSRMFLPRGGSARIWTEPDDRAPIPDQVVASVTAAIDAEMLRRAAALPPVELALLDEGLADLHAPAAERSASATLVRLTRGSVRPIPSGDRLRLFLHWAEPDGERVDLDLSVALFDPRWSFVDLCDYTNLRVGGDAAVHSGDLTSAPEPLGASEFVDLDIESLREDGARYAVPIVFSYNDVPFERLVRGFAGFLDSSDAHSGVAFDPFAVRQRFDLTGSAKILVPFVADLWSRTMRWADLNLSTSGFMHDVWAYHGQLARLGSTLEDAYGLGERVTLWEVARWHAAARARRVVVRHRDGSRVHYVRGDDEESAEFAARLTASHEAGRAEPSSAASGDAAAPPYEDALGTSRGESSGTSLGGTSLGGTSLGGTSLGGAELAVLVDAGDSAGVGVELGGGAGIREGAQVYALHPGSLDPAEVRMLDAADLVAALAPAPL